jgi:hypothetical protein
MMVWRRAAFIASMGMRVAVKIGRALILVVAAGGRARRRCGCGYCSHPIGALEPNLF